MLQMGKKYAWSEIVEAYPDKWAFITDVKMKDGEILTCKLLAVCNAEERYMYVRQYLKDKIKFECERTTFNGPNIGVLA